MTFIPDSGWGVAYMLACFGAAAISFASRNANAKNVAAVFLLHWFTMRLIDFAWYDYAALWVAHDAAIILALCAYGWLKHSRLAFSCAAVFFVVMLFDQYWWLFDSTFNANAAVAEAGGYLCFIMITGAAIGTFGTGRHSTGFRFDDAVYSLEGRRSISRHAEMSGRYVASNQNHQTENRGAQS